MVEEILDSQHLDTFLKRNRVALVAYAPRDSIEWSYMKRLLSRLEAKAGYLMSIAIADSSILRERSASVTIKLYLEKSPIFEQQGIFGNHDLDYEALRRGIKDVLKRRSFKTLF
ncbi:MAG: hypothetical protein GXO32_02835 [Crenarchaeota archaeon]|nr:hypothetical protein [Thermoproteota archaeon]